MKLVHDRDVRERMALPNIDVVSRAIGRTLDGVTDALEAELSTIFAADTGIVKRYYVPDSFLTGDRFNVTLYLDRGLISEVVSDVTVETAYRKLGLLQGDTLDLRDTSGAHVDHKDQFVTIDADGGLVVVEDFRVLRQYVQVTYDAGIAVDRNRPTEMYLQSPITTTDSFSFVDSDPDTITRSAGDFEADNIQVGDVISVTGTVSNDGTYTVAGVATLTLTLAATDSLTTEGPVSSTIEVLSEQPVPSWLKELAILQTMLELTSDKTVGIEVNNQQAGDMLRPNVLKQQIDTLVDRYTRFRPDAIAPTL